MKFWWNLGVWLIGILLIAGVGWCLWHLGLVYHWTGQHSGKIKDLAQVFAWAAAGGYFLFKMITGYFTINLSVSVSAERQRINRNRDFLKAVVTIKKGDRGTFRLHDVKLRVKHNGKVDDLKLDVQRFSFRRGEKTLSIRMDQQVDCPMFCASR